MDIAEESNAASSTLQDNVSWTLPRRAWGHVNNGAPPRYGKTRKTKTCHSRERHGLQPLRRLKPAGRWAADAEAL